MERQPGSDGPDTPAPAGPPGAAGPGRAGGVDGPAGWVGAVSRVQLTVTDADTAQAIGSGDVPVLGTPRLLAVAEAAAVAATATRLPPGTTTVGVRVELEHHRATPVGRTVLAEAKLSKVDGRRLTFEVTVREDTTVVADGRIERILVDRPAFLRKAFEEA